MLRLVRDGPEIPLQVLAAHEQERLVFFCGAGISMETGLPDFTGLVDDVYADIGEVQDAAEAAAYKEGRLDKVPGLLEDRVVRHAVRRSVIARLSRASTASLDLHAALLELAKLRGGGYRLVTTNFDNRFSESKLPEEYIDGAPKLPVPKPDTWHSLVHLHGRVKADDPEGRHLVLTTADFGTAYLTERWASRFITELAREFTLLFVGYSVGDPVVAYMIDALAAERARGRLFREAFAFAPYGGIKGRDKQMALWKAKGVVPILYRLTRGNRHEKLKDAIVQWAKLFRGGLASRTQIALDRAAVRPVGPTDDATRALVWALFEQRGSVAQEFAKSDPCPSFEWVEMFEKVAIEDQPWNGAEVKPLALPTPLRIDASGRKVPFPTLLVDGGMTTGQPLPLHPVTWALGAWMSKHLHDQRLLAWVLAQGGVLHPDMRLLIREALSK